MDRAFSLPAVMSMRISSISSLVKTIPCNLTLELIGARLFARPLGRVKRDFPLPTASRAMMVFTTVSRRGSLDEHYNCQDPS
ncbi:hypothetical protein, partial [Metallibacterium scheffleri]|uniref:hypothetical protein n=1 Tax=Metallibacterium scheffleri TaxID=993689 RepID=UPI001B36D73D